MSAREKENKVDILLTMSFLCLSPKQPSHTNYGKSKERKIHLSDYDDDDEGKESKSHYFARRTNFFHYTSMWFAKPLHYFIAFRIVKMLIDFAFFASFLPFRTINIIVLLPFFPFTFGKKTDKRQQQQRK